jgi:CCR4-NOT transcription complex subunit 1
VCNNVSFGIKLVDTALISIISTIRRNQAEIRSLSEQHGVETYLHFIRRLIAASQARLSSTTAPAAFDTSSALTFRLLVQETQRLSRDPFLADRFRDAIDKGEGDIFRHFDLVRFSDRVGLRPLERLILASSIISTSTIRRELAAQASSIIRVNFDEAVLAICKHPSFDHDDISPSQLAKLLSHLLSDPPPDSPVLDPSQRVALIVAAQAKYGLDIMAPILQKIFPTLRFVIILCSCCFVTAHTFKCISLAPGTSLVQTLCQLGPDLTSDPDTVLALLRRFGVSENIPPRETQVVEILSTLARYASEGTALCDVGSLVKAISSLVRSPRMWRDIYSLTIVSPLARPNRLVQRPSLCL